VDPAKVETRHRFANSPKQVWEWYRERRQRIRSAHPNPAHQAIVKLAAHADEFLLVTQNVDDLHLRAESDGQRLSRDKIVQIHGDIFETRCSRCESRWRELEYEHERDELPKCGICGALMRPGVIWFGEQLDARKIERVENYLARASCDVVIVAGTTAAFGYIIDWAMRARGQAGQLIEVNPDPTALSAFATQLIREPAGIALPRLVDRLVSDHSW